MRLGDLAALISEGIGGRESPVAIIDVIGHRFTLASKGDRAVGTPKHIPGQVLLMRQSPAGRYCSPVSAGTEECIWNCGRPADSREDVLAEWIRKYLGAKISSEKTWHLRDLTPVGSPVPTLRNPRPDARRYLRLRTKKVVCADCNNRWMSELQEQARPTLTAMFDGDAVSLGPASRSTLLSWATMTAICNHYATELEVDPARRDYFYNHRAPPKYTEVFAAHIDQPRLDTMHGSGGWRETLGKAPLAYIDLFGIRHAAFLILQGWMPQQARAVLDRVAADCVTLRPEVDLRSIDWPVASLSTESFSRLYDDLLTAMSGES